MIGSARAGFGSTWLPLAAIATLLRLPSLLYGRAIDDEAVYGVVARVMVHGGLPYRDAIERKPPLLFGLYGSVFELFGDGNWWALHLVALGWVLLTMAALHWLATELAGERAGFLAALGYALFQPFATAKNLAFNGEVLMNLPLALAYALVLRPRAGGLLAPLAAGALCALAFLLKQPAAIAALPLGLYLLRRGVAQAAALTAGFAAVLAACAAVLARHGLFAEAWYWTVLDHDVPHVFWGRALAHTALFVTLCLPLVLPLAFPARLGEAWQGRRPEFLALLGWAVVSAIGAAAGGRFYPHYYIQLIPPLAVLAAPFWAGMARSSRLRRLVPGWTALGCIVSLLVAAVQLFHANPPSPAGEWLRGHSAPGDRLFVWGQKTPVYLDADRLPASRYIATFPLTGYIFGERIPGLSTRDRIVPGAWDRLRADFAAHPPRFIVDTEAAPDSAYPIRDFPFMAGLVGRKYRRVATVADGVVYRAK